MGTPEKRREEEEVETEVLDEVEASLTRRRQPWEPLVGAELDTRISVVDDESASFYDDLLEDPRVECLTELGCFTE